MKFAKSILFVTGVLLSSLSFSEEISIFMASDDNFAKPTAVTIASVLANADKDDSFIFYILDNGIKAENREKIKRLEKDGICKIDFLDFRKTELVNLKIFHEHKVWGLTTLGRYVIPIFKKDLNKCLWLDGDVVVLRSLKEFWNTDLDDNYIAAALDLPASIAHINKLYDFASKNGYAISDGRYFNAGVALWNCKKCREDNVYEKLIKCTKVLANSNDCQIFSLPDQDVCNVVFNGKVKYIPMRYNFLSQLSQIDELKYFVYLKARGKRIPNGLIGREVYLNDFAKLFSEYIFELKNLNIYHYSGRSEKPWKISCRDPMQMLYFKYLKQTEFYDWQDQIFEIYCKIKHRLKFWFKKNVSCFCSDPSLLNINWNEVFEK